jgi:nucleoside-diphosphate-sugar epimerase
MIRDVDRIELGNPNPVRDFLFIEDEVRAFERMLQAGTEVHGEVFNTGTNRGIEIKELVNLIADLTGYDGHIVWRSNSHRLLEIDKLVADYSKLDEYVGWEPHYSLRDGLEETVRMWSS